MNTNMSLAPKKGCLIAVHFAEGMEWVSAKWSPLHDCWVSTWGLCRVYDPIGWAPFPEFEEVAKAA